MRNKFDEQLRQLSEELLIMAEMVQSAIQSAVTALFAQDTKKAKTIMEGDALVDQQQPVARDLRTITSAMKMVTDMERIGDQAADISELTIMMANSPYILDLENIRKMAAETIVMLLHATESYVEKDAAKAREVIAHDDTVDELFLAVKAELISIMKENPEYEEHAADLLMVNKYLERIGDHATNIAEWVIFALDDKTVKGE